MLTAQLTEKVNKLTKKKDLEQSLKAILPEFLKLKIYFIKHQIAKYEMKWGMTYEEFEIKSVEITDGFSEDIEKEYYEWGENVALLQYYQKNLKVWI